MVVHAAAILTSAHHAKRTRFLRVNISIRFVRYVIRLIVIISISDKLVSKQAPSNQVFYSVVLTIKEEEEISNKLK